jgi:hypothetical protein
MIKASDGVSNKDEQVITSVSPMIKTDELDTPMMRISPTETSLLITVKFIWIHVRFRLAYLNIDLTRLICLF